MNHFSMIIEVSVHLSESVIVTPLDAIREKRDCAIAIASQAMKEAPPMKDLRRYLSRSNPSLKAQLEDCKTNDDILQLVWSKCSLSNIDPVEDIVNQFEVEAVKPFIEEYRTSIEKLFDNIPLRSYLHGRVTIRIDRSVKDKTFNDVEGLLQAYVSYFDSDITLFVIKEGK